MRSPFDFEWRSNWRIEAETILPRWKPQLNCVARAGERGESELKTWTKGVPSPGLAAPSTLFDDARREGEQ
ncbi:hypothetical protein [Burkholderia arboris]|uniref:hypothetical protein n=1 Tax=Burkholderia arboris TaxID=488730 RepID=UPI0012D9230F|nr:hypothetical protein [Burkholderia arboris]MCA8491089.1 hypothetical protein [Burkholderia arboris]